MAAYIETALVSSSGRLLIQLDDGTVIDAGYVRGGQGPAGRDGKDGAPGIPGARGEAGTNGARWITGLGAPEISEGENGDLYLDVGASYLPLYQKVNGSWLLLCNLKVPPSGGGGGAGGAAGGGGSVILYPKPDGGSPPTQDNSGNPIDKGDIWLDTNTGWLWVYDGSIWIPVGDRPPVIVGPNPPLFNNATDDPNTRYPVKEGDLWFDSDQAALYVAALNGDGDLVWVISTPADRSILQDEIPVGGFVFPAVTQDGDTVFNDTTGLWYVYNGSKNQWIDLPPGERELSYPGILREADPAIDETYEGEADAEDGDVYLNAPDHEAGTRLVIRKVDRKGFTWTDFIQGLIDGDGIALVQTNYDNGPDNPQTQRVDYLIVSNIVENADSFSIEVEYEHQNFDHDPLFGEEVSVRFLAQVSSPAVCVTYEEATPEPKCVGHLWFDSSDDQGALKIWNGEYWIPASPPTSLDGVNSVINSALEVQAEILARLDTGEAAQATLQDTVTDALDVQNTLVNRVEALEGTVIDGKWMLDNRSVVREGYFIGLAPTGATLDWTEVIRLQMNPVDSTGKSFTFAEVSIDDVVRIGGVGGSAVFKMASGFTQAGDVYEADVQLLSHSGVMAESLTYDFEFLPSFDPSTYATIEYVNEQDDLDVKKTGDTMTGDLQLTGGDRNIQVIGGNRLRIGGRDSSNNGRTYIDIQTASSSGTAGTDAGYRLKLYHLATPTAPLHAANMQYVDDQVDGLASEEYVDNAVANIPTQDLSSYATKSFAEDLAYRPARLRWLYEGKDGGNSTPAHQSFKFDGKFIRCSFITLNNVDLSVGLVGDTGPVEFTDGPVGIIWYRDGNLKWKMKQQFRINAWRWNYNGHFEFARSSKHPDNDGTAFTVGAAYYITVGGFF